MSDMRLDVDQAGELKAAFRRFGYTNEQIKSLCENELLRQARAVMMGEARFVPIPLLTEITTVSFLAVERFEAAVAFGPGSGINFHLGGNFRKYLLPKVEENVPAWPGLIHRLERNSLDAPIRAELTPTRERTYLAHLHQLIKAQPNGEEGPLPVDGSAVVIAYIDGVVPEGEEEEATEPWAVHAYCFVDFRRWDVSAFPVACPGGWYAGFQVLSGK